MRFEYARKTYRIGFHHALSRAWSDHRDHRLWLDPSAVLWCDSCDVQLSHVPRAERIRTTSCTIYEEVIADAGGNTKSFALVALFTGVARPNLDAGDRFEREKGRRVSLALALTETDRGFRAAAWEAYLGRKRKQLG